MKVPVKESGVLRACLDLLEAEGIRHWRMNSGDRFGSYKGKTWRIKGHPKGTPDLLAIVQVEIDSYYHVPTPVWVECKAPGKQPSAEQLQFADIARNNGEYWLLVDDVVQLQEWLRDNRAIR